MNSRASNQFKNANRGTLTMPSDEQYNFAHNYGFVSRLYPNRWGVQFSLVDGETANAAAPSGYYVLRPDHPNYKALLAVLYMAATNRYRIHVETQHDPEGVVEYFVVDW